MLGQRRRRWANINPTLVQRLVFSGQGYWATVSDVRPILNQTPDCWDIDKGVDLTQHLREVEAIF